MMVSRVVDSPCCECAALSYCHLLSFALLIMRFALLILSLALSPDDLYMHYKCGCIGSHEI